MANVEGGQGHKDKHFEARNGHVQCGGSNIYV